ncbi:hypothetical protein [Streptomyces sp. P17]|uniref:hypothetical protein n=1 Tax=Streptomyces sp. P17 TaxID=3074716 RepID=UPI0028F455AD|nr:hypothetical protein [Streptomyces sp. P17]MDT9698106.1 hypothetical protein [Streptomyces sp. P17]
MSAYGNYLNLIAFSLFSYEVTGTAFGIGAVMALRLLAAGLGRRTGAAARADRLRGTWCWPRPARTGPGGTGRRRSG